MRDLTIHSEGVWSCDVVRFIKLTKHIGLIAVLELQWIEDKDNKDCKKKFNKTDVNELTMQATLQISAGGPYSEPSRTSRARYCWVWISSQKCLYWNMWMNFTLLYVGSQMLSNTTQQYWNVLLFYTECMKPYTHHPAGTTQVCDFHRNIL